MSEPTATQATHLTLSVPSTVSSWVLDELNSPVYTGYLRRVHAGPVAVGTEWEEFVSRGCGLPTPVALRVEAVAGGYDVGSETAITYTKRTARA